MLFKEILIEKSKLLEPEFDRLFNIILKRQTHDGDLLLTYINGFYHPEVHTWILEEKLSPYVIGPGEEGHSHDLQYQFIHNYRTKSIVNITHQEYLKELIWSPDRKDIIEELEDEEGFSIQLEMLIYLKIWEADLFIKRFYQIAKLLNGEPYDWHFKIAESNRNKSATGKRHEIILNQIRDRFETEFPIIYEAFKSSYKTQLRNAIAHSKYSFLGRHIHLNNYVEKDPASQMKALSFDQWIDIFHVTMVIYNEMIGFLNKVNNVYATCAMENNNTIQARINRKDPSEYTEYILLEYRPKWKDWRPKNN